MLGPPSLPETSHIQRRTQIPWKSRHTTRLAVKLPASSFPVPLLASQLSGSQPLPPATLPEATTPSEILARRQPDPNQARLVGAAAPLVRNLIIHHLPRASTPPQTARDTSTPSCKAAQPRFRPLRRLVVAPRPAPLLVSSPFTSAPHPRPRRPLRLAHGLIASAWLACLPESSRLTLAPPPHTTTTTTSAAPPPHPSPPSTTSASTTSAAAAARCPSTTAANPVRPYSPAASRLAHSLCSGSIASHRCPIGARPVLRLGHLACSCAPALEPRHSSCARPRATTTLLTTSFDPFRSSSP